MNTPKSNTGPFTLRAVVAGDRAAWRMLYRGYAAFYDAPMDDGILDRTWSWLLDGDHPQQGIVAALATGELVGLVHFRSFPEPLLGRDACYLDDLFVDPGQRGNGIGRCLIDAVVAVARERDWAFVRWITARDNATARQLYDAVAEETGWVTYDLSP